MANKSSLFAKRQSLTSAPEVTVRDHIAEQEQVEKFLRTYESPSDGSQIYMDQLMRIVQNEEKLLRVELDHLSEFDSEGKLLASLIQNAASFQKHFEQAADAICEELIKDFPETLDDLEGPEVLAHHRRMMIERIQELAGVEDQTTQEDKIKNGFPAELFRKYEVIFVPSAKMKPQPLRALKASQIGRFVSMRGIVTRVGEVMPRIIVACYMCQNCGTEINEPVRTRDFTPKTDCGSAKCSKTRKGRDQLVLRPKYCKFVKFQELRVQELPEHVPIGNVPRSIVVEARGESTRKCTAGDVVQVTGIFFPERPRINFRTMSSGGNPLVLSTFLQCMEIRREKRDLASLTDHDASLLDAAIETQKRAGRKMYDLLAKSIAPEIYGHDDVKKAILLQLVGGVAKNMKDGMKIRGDINVALFGDPGVAKSQLLKHVTSVAPRAVYTTGKGSSGVGLTAAVTRDSFTGEVALEGGALVLADRGICCIDEFDKMEESDRTAIHEVMEQQTVSIAKAGITTTLNARTAVLAAANPLYGRYNKKLSPTQNINLPAALLSRFDLLFLLLDKVGAERDRSLAEHVTYVHMHNRHPTLELETLPSQVVRGYIERCREKNPIIPDTESDNPEVRERGRRVLSHIVEAYVDMRQQDASDTENDHAKSALTPRQLLSILRLASAHARVRLANEITEEDVDEAIRLVRASKSSLEDDENVETERDDPVSRIFRMIKDMIGGKVDETNPNPILAYSELEERVLRAGFTREQLKKTLDEYSSDMMNVLHVDSARTSIRLTEIDGY